MAPPPAPPLPPPAPPRSLPLRVGRGVPGSPQTPSAAEYPPVAFYFTVCFDTTLRDVDCSFREVSGIGAELETESVSEGGESRYVLQLPKAVKSQRLVLKRGVAPMRSRMVKWCTRVLEGDLSQPIVPKMMWVSLLSENGDPLRTWSFENAYPVKWEVEPFQSNKNEVALEKIELTYLYAKREV
jgi:phage tail-like protein